ncbi:MAG: mechanosensitive ion channel family protein [Gemmatimonadota bacterium]
MEELIDRLPTWANDDLWRWVAALLLLAGALLAYRVLTRQISRQVADAEKRHRYRKRVGYTIGLFVALIVVIAFIEQIRALGTMIGFIGAGLFIALREYVASFLAWFYIMGQRNITLGSRIELGSVRGDVIDIGVLKLTLVEVRGEGLGDQSSGRLVTIPNFKVITDPVLHLTPGSPYVWDEMEFSITFESEWKKAREILERVGGEVFDPHQQEIEAGFRQLEHDYAFRYGVTTPIVYLAVTTSGIQLKLRYLTHVRQRRDNRDVITRRVLELFRQAEDIEFAYPTSRVYRTDIDLERFGERPVEPFEGLKGVSDRGP